ncbi:MAG: DUF6067 family protein [Kiritimatiellae bacterium]|nr:DUF6067 family protein [Kiritimatiellia bacterium]
MNNQRGRALLACVGWIAACWLTHAAGTTNSIAAARKPYARGELRKLISVVKAGKPPAIDGIMSPGEWDDAVRVTGLIKNGKSGQAGATPPVENMASEQSVFWIAYDDENLYVAHHSPPPERIKDSPALIAVMLRRSQTLHDANTDSDDCIGIDIIDPVYPGGDKYAILVNSIGTTFECVWNMENYAWEKALMDKHLGHLPGITIGWDPRVLNKSTLTLDGWVIETAIPWKNLGPNIKKPQTGEVKYMNFSRLWREMLEESNAWAVDDAPSPAGEVCFMGDDGIVVQLEDTGNLPRGQARLAAQIKNRYAAERKVIVETSTNSGELKDRKELALKPGASAPYEFKGMISDFATTKIAFTVTDATSGKPVHVTTLPVIRPTTPDIYVRRYRSQEIMKFETDIAFVGAADIKKVRVKLTVTEKATKREVFGKTFKGLDSYEPSFELSTKGWVPGDYEARFVFTAPGMKPYQTVVSCEYPPLPVWWDNNCGYQDMEKDKVPYPWTDMAVAGDTIRAWGRDYCFGKRFLPEQITTLEQPILRAPMRVVVKTADGEVLDTSTVDAKAEWTKIRRTRIEGRMLVEGKAVSLENSLWAEYDGFLWCTLKVTPRANADVASLEMELPLTREFTDVINPCDYSLRTTGKLKPEGYTGAFERPIWLGNGDGGIQLLGGADNRYFIKEFRKGIRVDVSQEGATLRLTMIDTPTAFKAPYEVQFGLMATPARPKLLHTPVFKRITQMGNGGWYPDGLEYVPAADPGRDYYGGGGGEGNGPYVHTSPFNVTPEALAKDAAKNREYLFADEFRANPRSRELMVTTDLKSKVARDFFVWRHQRYQDKYGLHALYIDGPGGRMLCLRDVMKRLYNIALDNHRFAADEAHIVIHMCAMPDMSAEAFGTGIWDGENLGSRINEQQQTYLGVVDPAVFRAVYMGHNFGWPVRVLGGGRLNRKWVAANGGPEAVIDQFQGLELLHDNTPTSWHLDSGGPMDAVCKRAKEAFAKYNLGDWVCQFLPYWHQDIVKLPDENMHASFYIARPSQITPGGEMSYGYASGYFNMGKYLPPYIASTMALRNVSEAERRDVARMKDRVVMVVYNNTVWEGVMRLKPDWKKIGLGSPDSLTATNAVHSSGFRLEKAKNDKGEEIEKGVFFPRPEEYAKIEGEELVFPMTKWNYRMIVLEKE